LEGSGHGILDGTYLKVGKLEDSWQLANMLNKQAQTACKGLSV